MAVTHSQQVHSDTVARARLDECVKYLGFDAVGRRLIGVQLLQVPPDIAAVVGEHLGKRQTVRDSLDKPLVGRSRERAIRRKLEVKALLLEQPVSGKRRQDTFKPVVIAISRATSAGPTTRPSEGFPSLPMEALNDEATLPTCSATCPSAAASG